MKGLVVLYQIVALAVKSPLGFFAAVSLFAFCPQNSPETQLQTCAPHFRDDPLLLRQRVNRLPPPSPAFFCRVIFSVSSLNTDTADYFLRRLMLTESALRACGLTANCDLGGQIPTWPFCRCVIVRLLSPKFPLDTAANLPATFSR